MPTPLSPGANTSVHPGVIDDRSAVGRQRGRVWRHVNGIQLVTAAVGVALGVGLWVAPLGLSPAIQRSMAIGGAMVWFWITEPIELYLTGLIGCYLFWALHVADFATAFGGFARETTWFLLGAFLLGAMARKTGLALRLGYLVLSRIGSSYGRILLGLIIVGFLITFFVPSGIARVSILAAMTLGVMRGFEATEHGNIGRGLFLILTYTASVFDKFIIAGASAILARGIITDVGKVPVSWGQWAIACLPGDLLTIVTCWLATLWLFPPERADLPDGRTFLRAELDRMGPWSVAEVRNAALMAVAVALWMTDFLHGVSAPVVGLGIGLAGCLPLVGVLDREDFARVNFPVLIFIGTVLSMGAVLAQTGVLSLLTQTIFDRMTPFLHGTAGTVVAIYSGTFVYHVFIGEDTVVIATLMPLLMDFARTHGLNPLAVGMIATIASAGKLFVYQSSVLVTGYAFGHFDAKDLVKIGIVLTLVELVVLLLLAFSYWPLFGIALR